ncbi:16S rRNA (cytosine967-C5)-methyltransferase [Crenobacter luteus]|uniref:RsmB/NOP family class I SAM-dependent RNA methyltransferase n=1 Tax=Crenobacter luteus TaxID=1452487 RepID=UPI00104B565E|nr:RsmB/NOP family class I SAM-dependent RNA methyltransferase [Crenobacter luteus]TCP11005.1 16S rRNA (cytosine967-C5)-methyltransferase [Crenobacter luteus]
MSLKPTQLKHLAEVITRLTAFDRPADAVLSAYFRENAKLGAQDRHLIAETAFACLRRYAQMSALCGPHPTARKLALATLTRVRGMNLRELEEALSKGEREWVIELKGKTPELDLAGQTELPAWVIERLGIDDEAEIRALARGLMESAPLDLRVNTLKMKRDAVLESLKAGGFDAGPTPYSPLGIRMKGKPALNRHPLFLEGAFEIQDEGSQLLGLITGARRGEMVVDFCAGAGGKTLLLGAQMASTGRLYAFDVSEKRLANLKPRLARSGLSNVHPQLIAHENDARIKRLAGKADRVLVDAPCSGLGTLRRNPDLKFRQSPESVARLNAMQKNILESAARLVKVGGRLVYATCSVLPLENRDVVNAFLAAHPEFELVPMSALLAEHKVALDTGDFLEMAPHKHDTDGFFAAALTRKG